jgi:hypothetical protein
MELEGLADAALALGRAAAPTGRVATYIPELGPPEARARVPFDPWG